MVGLRRFGLLLALFLVALAVVIARLYDVMVVEHPIWAREAANLTRSWSVEPYLRGSILDRNGRVWVRDEEVYELELVWRDFRRGHPLGQVAQARSLIEQRSVPLGEVHRNLLQTAVELVRLSPARIDAFGKGAALAVGESRAPALERSAARSARRSARAAELHWYVRTLLRPTRAEERSLRDAKGSSAWNEPYVALVAAKRGQPASSLEKDLRERLAESLVRLGEFAVALDLDSESAATPFARLLALLEEKREEVEFAVADDLFRRAAGFPATRLDERNLRSIDLLWLAAALNWDRARLNEWAASRGRSWPQSLRDSLAGLAIARAKVAREWQRPDDQMLSALASLFAAHHPTEAGSALPVDWRRQDDLVVLAEFPRRFEHTGTIPKVLFESLLPFQDEELRASPYPREEGELLARVIRDTDGLPATDGEQDPVRAAARAMASAARQSYPTWRRAQELPVRAVLADWDGRLQRRVRTLFENMPGGGELRRRFIDEALETRAYVIRDRESRPLRFERTPAYDLVHLVTRYPADYAGFHIHRATRRVPMAVADLPDLSHPPLVAETLIGRTRTPYLVKVLEQRPQEERLHEEQRRLERDESTREWIERTAATLYAPGASTGNGGIEEHFDPELRGKNGYSEHVGLQERAEGRSPLAIAPVDGQSLTLTLDLDLQRAWEQVLEHPAPPPPDEPKPDRAWHRSPVGAAVLMTVDGEVLVAASTPRVPDDIDAPGYAGWYQDGQRGLAVDRTLRMITFNPPGSVVKPLLAAWGLQKGIITPSTRFECWVHPGDPSRYGSHRKGAVVHCLSSPGHGELPGGVVLDTALRKSCNAYFAQLGEKLGGKDAFREAYHAFGLDRPTGVRIPGRTGGLVEDYRATREFESESVLTAPMAQRMANGLSHINATPMQIARAYAALATGRLPRVRLVRAIGGKSVPTQWEPLPIDPRHLETVRASLAQVVFSGTARGKGLTPEELGFHLACKTGSADYNTRTGRVPRDPRAPLTMDPGAWEKGDRKHGWLAGFFPAEDPKLVIVVYCHDTTTTSSHIATHIARQLLTHPATQAYLQGVLGQ